MIPADLFSRDKCLVLELISGQSVETLDQAHPRGQQVLEALCLRGHVCLAPGPPVTRVQDDGAGLHSTVKNRCTEPVMSDLQVGERQRGPGVAGDGQDEQGLHHHLLHRDLVLHGGPGAPDDIEAGAPDLVDDGPAEVARPDDGDPGGELLRDGDNLGPGLDVISDCSVRHCRKHCILLIPPGSPNTSASHYSNWRLNNQCAQYQYRWH